MEINFATQPGEQLLPKKERKSKGNKLSTATSRGPRSLGNFLFQFQVIEIQPKHFGISAFFFFFKFRLRYKFLMHRESGGFQDQNHRKPDG